MLPADNERAAALVSEDADMDVEELSESGEVDLGEIASQYLSLQIDPYATAPGASLDLPGA